MSRRPESATDLWESAQAESKQKAREGKERAGERGRGSEWPAPGAEGRKTVVLEARTEESRVAGTTLRTGTVRIIQFAEGKKKPPRCKEAKKREEKKGKREGASREQQRGSTSNNKKAQARARW